MDLLIKSATIVDPDTRLNGTKTDILIEDGRIKKIGKGLIAGDNISVVASDDLHVSIGWMDMQVCFNDPGLEHREDLQSGCAAAASGGFTAVACMSSSHTPTQSKSEVEYIKQKTKAYAVDVLPIAALSQDMEGKAMTEMYDLKNAGAVAFSDSKKPLKDTGLLSRSMLYAKGLNVPVIVYPEDVLLAGEAKINEGEMSTLLGMKGIPALAEEIMVARDIALAKYHETGLHFSTISTLKSVDLIRAAKQNGVAITCGVAVHNLVLNEGALVDFDSNYKVKPPLRASADVEALWKGLADGTIDIICSDHSPQDIESKEKEFEHAAYGMIGLESCYALLQTNNKNLSLAQLIDKLALAPRKILQLEIPKIAEGSIANLTLFSPTEKWIFEEKNIKSKSKNTPFIGAALIGRVIGIVNKNCYLKN